MRLHDSECSKIRIVARLADALPRPKLHFRMTSLLADITPLRRHQPFRRLWVGLLISSVGGQLTIVGVYSADRLVEFTHQATPWFSACLDGAAQSWCSGSSTSYGSDFCCWASPGHRTSSERCFAF